MSDRFGKTAADQKFPGPGSYLEAEDTKAAASKDLKQLGHFEGNIQYQCSMTKYLKCSTILIAPHLNLWMCTITGGFGSCSTRFSDKVSYTGSTSANVGPGTYEGELDVQTTKMLQKRRHNGMSSSFSSKDSRDKVVTKSLGLSGAANLPAPVCHYLITI